MNILKLAWIRWSASVKMRLAKCEICGKRGNIFRDGKCYECYKESSGERMCFWEIFE